MTDTFIAYILLAISVLLFGFALGYFFFIYEKEKEFEQKEAQTFNSYKKILRHAHQRARSVLNNATEKAKQILTATEAVNEEVQEDLDKSLQEVIDKSARTLDESTDHLLEGYQDATKDVKNEYVKEMKQTLGNLNRLTEEELKNFVDVLKQETTGAQRFIGEKINTEFENAQKEIAAYKKGQMDKIDSSIKQMVSKVSEDVLGKAISLADHEELILESLERAKKEGILV